MNISLMIIIGVQIIFESLPVSSSGHVALFRSLFGLTTIESFEGLLFFPTIIIVLLFFFRDWFSLLSSLSASLFTMRPSQRKLWSLVWPLSGYVTVTTGITALGYYFLRVVLRDNLVLQSPGMLSFGLFVTTITLLSARCIKDRPCEILTWRKAVVLGLVQATALLPGISRLGSTYVAARWLNLSERRSFQLSFLIFFPIMGAALIRDAIPFLKNGSWSLGCDEWSLLAFACIVAWDMFHLTYRLVLNKKLWVVGLYMMVPLLVSITFLVY